MKKYFLNLFFVGLLFPSAAMAMTDYKCYISLSNAQPWITQIFAENAAEAEKSIKNQFVRVNRRRLRINHIFECVPIQRNFNNESAQKLEKNTRF